MTGATVVVGDARSLRIKIDAEPVRRVLARAPRPAYFWLRDFLFRAFTQHRVAWLEEKGTRFGRGGIKVHRVNEGPDIPGDLDVVYQVRPKERRFASDRRAAAAIDELRADAYTGNSVLPHHEFGEPVVSRTGRLMSVPIRTRPGSPSAWRAANPGKVLIAKRSRGGPAVLLFERQRRKARGRPRRYGRTRTVTERLRLRFLLTPRVEMQPTLHMYDSWEAQADDRDRLWSQTADRMIRDMARGVD